MRSTDPTVPCVEIVSVSSVVLNSQVSLTSSWLGTHCQEAKRVTHPLSAVMKTKATSLPVATRAAVERSVSLREEDTTVPSVLARDVMASRGWKAWSVRDKR